MQDIIWLIDVGNTAIKVGRFLGRGRFELVELDDVVGTVALVCCVRKQWNSEVFVKKGVSLRFVSAADIPMKTLYRIDEIGTDRLLASFAVTKTLSLQCFVVVDAGTMITVDFVEDGIHKGGVVLPGVWKLRECYSSVLGGTFGKEDAYLHGLENFPYATSTSCAIGMGIYFFLSSLENLFGDFQNIVFTGGAGEFLSNLFVSKEGKSKRQYLYIPNLVLYGLSYLLD